MTLTSIKPGRFASFLLIVVLLQLASISPIVELLYRPLTVNDLPEQCEAIVILSSDFFDSGLPALRTYTRLTKGHELYRKGLAPLIVCAGGNRIPATENSFAGAMKQTLVSWGVAEKAVLVQDETINTYNDIRYLTQRSGMKINFNRTVFVTSSYHTLRVKMILNKMGLRAKVVSADPIEMHPNNWSIRVDFFREVLREYGALVYFKCKGWI